VLRAAPGAFPPNVRPPEGGSWLAGGRSWAVNPRYAIPPAYFHVVRLWNRCASGMGGFAQLPEPGGVNAQPAWLMEAFGILSAADAKAAEPP
jgi:hypothetical protein